MALLLTIQAMTTVKNLDQKVSAGRGKNFTFSDVDETGKTVTVEPTIREVFLSAIYAFKDLKGDIKALRRQMKLADIFDMLETTEVELSNENAVLLRDMMVQVTNALPYGRPPVMSGVLVSRAMIISGLDDEADEEKKEDKKPGSN